VLTPYRQPRDPHGVTVRLRVSFLDLGRRRTTQVVGMDGSSSERRSGPLTTAPFSRSVERRIGHLLTDRPLSYDVQNGFTV
jgi:hypothetical protein